MEFVNFKDVMQVLADEGVRQIIDEEGDSLQLAFAEEIQPIRFHLTHDTDLVTPVDGATMCTLAREQLPKMIESLSHKLHLSQLVLVPIGKWRKVFDAVAFSLAENEDWQEIDAAATVELNTRDPLLCGPGDLHTLSALVDALLHDGESSEHGMTIATSVSPVLIEIVPPGAIRLTVGDEALADEVREMLDR